MDAAALRLCSDGPVSVPLRYTRDAWATSHAIAVPPPSDHGPLPGSAAVRWQPGFCVRPSRETPGTYRVELYDLVAACRPVCTLRVKVNRAGALVEPGDEYSTATARYKTLAPGVPEHEARVTMHLRWIGYTLDYEQRRQRQTTATIRA
jgi:hypothetical protein